MQGQGTESLAKGGIFLRLKKSNGVIYNTVLTLLWPVFKLLYRFDVEGSENIPRDGKCIICPNHTSNADPILLGISNGRKLFFMAKVELFQNKIMSSIFKFFGAFPVDRGNSDKTAIKTATQVLEDDEPLVIFIEGTRSKTGELLRPKSGAAMLSFKTNTPIIPVFIGPAGGGRVKILKKIYVRIGTPVDPKVLGFETGASKEFRDASRKVMKKIKELREKS